MDCILYKLLDKCEFDHHLVCIHIKSAGQTVEKIYVAGFASLAQIDFCQMLEMANKATYHISNQLDILAKSKLQYIPVQVKQAFGFFSVVGTEKFNNGIQSTSKRSTVNARN